MANENMIKFLRGNVASLPATATPGAVYFTKDEGLYLGLEDGSYHRYGDFITVNDVAALPTEGAHETCMYYCVSENILAKWSESEGKWIQINKQKTLAELGGVAKSVYDAKMAALEKADSDNATAIDNLNKKVGTIPATATATDIIGYIQEKTSGIATSDNLAELTGRVATAEGEIDVLQEAIAEGGSVTVAIANAKAAGDAAQADVDALEGKVGTVAEGTTVVGMIEAVDELADQGIADAATAQARADEAYNLANGKATMEQVNAAIAGAGHAVKSEVEQAISDMDAAYKKADSDMKSELEGKINAKVAQSDYDAKVAELAGADTTLQGNIDALAGKVGELPEGATATTVVGYVDEKVAAINSDASDLADRVKAIEDDYLVGEDKTELEGKITAEENRAKGVEESLQTQINTIMNNPDAEGAINSINEFTQYVKDHGTIAEGMRTDINKNKDDIAALAKDLGDHETLAASTYETKSDATSKKTEIDGRLDALEGKVDVEKVSTAISDAVKVETDRATGAEAGLAGRIKDLEDNKAGYATTGAVATAKQEAIDAAQGKVDALANGQVKTNKEAIEAINDASTGLLKQAKDYADGLADNYAEADHDHVVADITDFDAKVKEYGYATTTYADNKAAAAQSAAEATAAGALASAKTELEGKITSGDSTTLASAQAYADEKDAALKTVLQAEIDADVKALADGQVATNKTDITSLFEQMTWGSF